MAQITVDPATGRLMIDGVPVTRENAYGTSGQFLGGDLQDVGLANPSSDYWRELGGYADESGNWVSRYDTRPEVLGRLGGLSQIGQYGVGGFDEVKDPARLSWSDEFGILTHPDNVSDRDPATRIRGLSYLAAIGGAGLAQNAGLLGGGGSGASAGGASGLASDIAPGFLSESVAPQVTEVMAGSPWASSPWQGILDYATKNPLNTARGALGIASALGGGSGSQGSSQGPTAPSGMTAPSFNPLGAAGQFQPNQGSYTPLQFDSVPFMGDSMYSPYQYQSPWQQYPQRQQWGGGNSGAFNAQALNFSGGLLGNQQGQPTMPQGMGYSGFSPVSRPQSYQPSMPSGMGYSGFSPVQMPGMGQQKPYMPPSFGMNQQTPSLPPGMGYAGGMSQGTPPGAQTMANPMNAYNAAAVGNRATPFANPPRDTTGSAMSAQGAGANAMSDYNSPAYASYYNSLPASTKAFMHKPGNAQTAAYLGNEAAGNWAAFNGQGINDPFQFALGYGRG